MALACDLVDTAIAVRGGKQIYQNLPTVKKRHRTNDEAAWGIFTPTLLEGDSSMVQEDLRNVKHIQSTESAFAAIRADGHVITWGNEVCGGDSHHLRDQLTNVSEIQATDYAFAALKTTGEVVCWGHPRFGGNCRVQSNVQLIQSNNGAFAAVAKGKVVAWGHEVHGGEAPMIKF